MKYLLFVALTISLMWNIINLNNFKDCERSLNRPMIESFVIAGSSEFDDRKPDEIGILVRLLILDFLNSGFYQPLTADFRDRCIKRLLFLADSKEIVAKIDEMFLGVTKIDKNHAVFLSEGKTRFVVMGGTRYVTQNLADQDCTLVIKNITNDFLKHINQKRNKLSSTD